MRRALALMVIVILGAGTAWLLWPSSGWPRAFCVPVARVVGSDDRALLPQILGQRVTVSGSEVGIIHNLELDVAHAKANAQTPTLRRELSRYQSQLAVGTTQSVIANAMNRFDERARTQLHGCGI